MNGKLSSLTDELKKTLFFFDGITAIDAATYVHHKMLQDYSLLQVEEKVNLCLKQNPCFTVDNNNLWRLCIEGSEENDSFYKTLLKKKEPISLRDVIKNSKTKKAKVTKKLAEEAALVTDARFVQLENGNWGLTEWYFEPEQYSIKHLVIKAFKIHANGASLAQLHETVNEWRNTTPQVIQQLLLKFPYFEQINKELYTYNEKIHLAHDRMVRRYLNLLKAQKQKWQYDREKLNIKINNLKKHIDEISSAQKEAAAALAERANVIDQYHNLSTQLSEKDLLLSMRKKEILRYREQLAKLESKANSILYQCRLWVRRAKDKEMEVAALKKYNEKNQTSLETMFSKLHQYKERDRENKAKMAELKEYYTNRIAELQTEIVELKQQLERTKENSQYEERKLYQDINHMSNDLKETLERAEELQKAVRLLEQELEKSKESKMRLESKLRPLPVRLVIKICSLFKPE
ncbi:phage-shock protein [Peptococcaceae bacterium 1198_IL3148]